MEDGGLVGRVEVGVADHVLGHVGHAGGIDLAGDADAGTTDVVTDAVGVDALERLHLKYPKTDVSGIVVR